MSKSRENVTWQSKDGSWNLGMYTVIDGDTSDEDYDSEWDVDYDFDTFWWVSTGHRTEESADASWHGANPGGGTLITYGADSAVECDAYDRMAAACTRTRLDARRASRPASTVGYGW